MRLTASVALVLALTVAAAPVKAAPIPDGEGGAGLAMPLSAFDRISSPYGWRIHPILRRPEFHKGVDFAAPAGTPVMASEAGTIEMAGRRGNYGHYVRLSHEGGLGTGYAHLARIRPGLHVGSQVQRGEVIGFVGASGLATGPHLFYEVFRDGGWIDPRTAGLPIGAACCREGDALLPSSRRGLPASTVPHRHHPTAPLKGMRQVAAVADLASLPIRSH